MFQVNWEFFQPIGKKFGTGNRTQFCIEKKPLDNFKLSWGQPSSKARLPPTNLTCDARGQLLISNPAMNVINVSKPVSTVLKIEPTELVAWRNILGTDLLLKQPLTHC